jgi:hypothetical protein
MDYVISGWDREWFKRCRRAWDFGSPTRQDYEPALPSRAFSLDQAIRDALAVYYYPAMWDWAPAIVRRLTLKGFVDSLARQRAASDHDRLPDAPLPEGEEHLALGQAMLEHYFEWAPVVDRFSPLLVATEFRADVVDPRSPGRELTTVDGDAVRYRGRIHLSVVDEHDLHWLVHHRVVDGPWDDIGLLSLDDAALASCWAWEHFSLVPLAGVIFNELRSVVPTSGQRVAAQLSERRRLDLDRKRGSVGQNVHRPRSPTRAKLPPGVEQHGNEFFRRTQIPVSRPRLADVAARVGWEALEMMSEGLLLYPDPVRENCAECPYRAPCVAMGDGAELAPMLAADFRKRHHRVDEVALGGLFGLNPNQMRVREFHSKFRPRTHPQ